MLTERLSIPGRQSRCKSSQTRSGESRLEIKTGQCCPAGNETGKGKPWTRPYSCNRGLSEEEEKEEEEEESSS